MEQSKISFVYGVAERFNKINSNEVTEKALKQVRNWFSKEEEATITLLHSLAKERDSRLREIKRAYMKSKSKAKLYAAITAAAILRARGIEYRKKHW